MFATFLSQPVVFGTSVSEVMQDAGLATLLWAVFKSFNCHVNSPRFCWLWGHRVPGTSFRACHKHTKERPSNGKVTAEHIAAVTNRNT